MVLSFSLHPFHFPNLEMEGVGLKVEAHAPFQDLNDFFLLKAPPLLLFWWAWQQRGRKCKVWFHKVRQWQYQLLELQQVGMVLLVLGLGKVH